MEMNKLICEECGKETFLPNSDLKWSHWTRCDCGGKAFWEGRPHRTPMTAFIKGYTYGYNEGLGVDIQSKEHYQQIVKEKGLEEVG